mmetsp:Transcript_8350/g.13072  ORF Transcript_8350/g.13072 Transcript_8350/m.13072 type:complete len:664 (-) Transcript_8350:212-2203(-)
MVSFMPRSWTLFLALTVALMPTSIAELTENLKECVPDGEYDPDLDYFPEKIVVDDSKFWEIQYFNNFKLLRNEIEGEEFVLYQCGTPPPTAEDLAELGLSDVDALHEIPVPLQHGVTLGSTTHITLLELLGLRREIKAWIGYYYDGFISSPCLNQLIDDGETTVITDTSSQESIDALLETAGPSVVSFHNFRGGYSSSLYNVTMSAYKEAGNKAIAEWLKFFAVFYNKEKLSTMLHDFANARYDCTANEADRNVAASGGKRPTVLWASWTDYDGTQGWSVGKSGTYYAEYADDCSADLITSRAGTIPYFGDFLFTTRDFVELAKTADIWIYSNSFNWDTAKELHKNAISGFKSVQTGQVFDSNGGGSNAWFENRLAEYDVVLEDFCAVVGTASPGHKRIWLRNVYTENIAENALTECKNPDAPLVPRYTPCTILDPVPITLCFSGISTVKLQDGNRIPMKDIKIGDRVQVTEDGQFDTVHSFGHYKQDSVAEYLSIHSTVKTSPITISAAHMLFLDSKKAVPASSIKVGDILLGGNPVTKIEKVSLKGAFAPFTSSGTIVVNDVVASNYVSLTGTSTYLGIDMQLIAHNAVSIRRIMCQLTSCNERYNEDGVATWIPLRAASFFAAQETGIMWLAIAVSTILIASMIAKSMMISCKVVRKERI